MHRLFTGDVVGLAKGDTFVVRTPGKPTTLIALEVTKHFGGGVAAEETAWIADRVYRDGTPWFTAENSDIRTRLIRER